MKITWILLLAFTVVGLAKSIFVKTAMAAEQVQKTLKYYWTCVMHPQVHMSGPGICPICHMDLVKREEKAVAAESKILDRKSISLDQKTFNLSGAKLYTVSKGPFSYEIKTFGKMNGGNQFSLYVAEKDQRYVKPGLDVTLKIPSLDLEEVRGKITRVDSYIEPMGRTVKVDGLLNSGQNLRAETSLTATISYSKDDVIKVPEDAVLHSGEKNYVFKLNKDQSTLVPSEVKIGLISMGEIEIVKGLEVGEVVTTHANFLIDSESRMNFGRP